MKSTTLSDGSLFQIWHDTDGGSPRSWDHLGTMSTFHERYDFTDEGAKKDFTGINGILAFMKDVNDHGGVALPVWGYDHGSFRIKAGERTYPFNDEWDSGLFGIIYVLADTLKATSVPRDKAESALKDEIATLNLYMNGEVYGYTLSNNEGDVVDSCGGYFGITSLKMNIAGIPGITEADKAVIEALVP